MLKRMKPTLPANDQHYITIPQDCYFSLTHTPLINTLPLSRSLSLSLSLSLPLCLFCFRSSPPSLQLCLLIVPSLRCPFLHAVVSHFCQSLPLLLPLLLLL